MEPDESGPEPPEEARSLLDAIERLRILGIQLHGDWWAYADTLRDIADASTVRDILQRMLSAMEAMSARSGQPGPTILFTTNYDRLLEAALPLVPTTLDGLADLEQAVEVASADPESRKLVARIAERLPSRAQVAKLTPWAVFVMVAAEMLKVAPELNPNDIGVLTMILMVVLYLLPPRSGS